MSEKFIAQFIKKNDFLSNFYVLKDHILFEGIFYNSVENAYQAAKTNDTKIKEKISLSTPYESKKIGKKVVLIDNWETIKRPIMYKLLLLKFSQQYMREKLLNTGDSILIEGNWWGDNYWGSSIFTKNDYMIDDTCISDNQILFLSSPWSTCNQLGKLLMLIREKIKLEKI
jgi:hypothetical protein